MKLEKILHLSFSHLRKHKIIVLPIIISLLLIPLFGFLYLNTIGLYQPIKEYKNQYIGYLEGKQESLSEMDFSDTNYTLNFLQYLSDKDFGNYLKKDRSIEGIIKDSLNKKNMYYLILFGIIYVIIYFYFFTATFALIKMTMKKEKVSLLNTIKNTNHFILRLFTLSILEILLLFLPLTLITAIIVISFMTNAVLGIIILLLGILLGIVWFLGVITFTFFTEAILFLDNKGPIYALKNSISIMKKYFKKMFVYPIIVLAILTILSMIRNPFSNSLFGLFLATNVLKFLWFLLLALILLIIQSAIYAFLYTFLFISYANFKSENI